ncbi:SafA/ExsA family spore coat assembly protein [Neobacillus sp. NPDC058068]|uniref:SafA/ExsA family spore coat assembly protein n=1 Tax=Neobacillus sp. NPDC058068 TaxID=3346325 RepID=UPI0036DAC181
MKIHIVQKGDTLWKIAKKYGVNFEELKKMNSQLSNPDMIMPGMKIKVPTAGGTVKKEGPIHIGKKEVPIAEHPFAKEKPKEMPIKQMPIKEVPIKEMPIKEIPKKEIPIKEIPKKEVPIKEVPIKEAPILKEAPKAPYTPKMPLKVIPEKDINNYYMSNMTNITPNLPPKPANILPEVKEVPMPLPMPVQQECVQDYCVPVTPVMPGPGFCPPFGGYPMQPYMPYPQVQGAAYAPTPSYVPGMAQGYPGAAPITAGAPAMPGHYFQDESSSFMPQMPIMNPAYNPGAVMGAQNPAVQPPYMAPGAYGQMPAGYGEMPGAYGQMPAGYGEMPGAYGQMPAGYGGNPGAYGQMPAGSGEMPGAYGQMPAGYGGTSGAYGQMPGGHGEMPGAYGQMPGGYGEMPGTYGQMPAGYGGMPGAYGQMPPAGYGGMPEALGQMPAGYGGMPGAYGQMPAGQMPAGQMPTGQMPTGRNGNPYGMGTPYGYPQISGSESQVPNFEASQGARTQAPYIQAQSLPVGAGGDCGCGGPGPSMDKMQPAGARPNEMPANFVPPTPPIYSAPYTGPVNAAQPPYMNPYGMAPAGTNYGMPGYRDESD